MRVWWKIHKGLVGCIIFALVALLAACSRPPVPCTNQVSSEEVSPSGKFKAVVFHRSCQEWVGSTITTNVSILRANENPGDGNGNVLSYKGNIGVRAGWLTEQRLAIYSFADLSDATRLETLGGVTIEYAKMIDADIVRPAPSAPPAPPAATPSASVDGK
jgi:hypothetical protein